VNIQECKKIEAAQLLLSLSNGVKLPISRRNFKNFKEKLPAVL
jgi:DNA-binding LytR/AlgR family response regulator